MLWQAASGRRCCRLKWRREGCWPLFRSIWRQQPLSFEGHVT
ncbi:hypothetical protein J2W40_000888 [Sphingobium xenophagum]|uniref:Transposase n=1 Tax=Sphingobium xenophagum TaxID=121428 RepID=A0ABU1WXQ2_SPHXE|nr:hypothetical protein [Sphingobium xenophagum]